MAADKISVQAWMFAVEYHQTERVYGLYKESKTSEGIKMDPRGGKRFHRQIMF